jgi:hypothetical protein
MLSFRSFAKASKEKKPKAGVQVIVCGPAATRSSGSLTFIMEVTPRSHNRDPEYFLLSA